MNDFPLTIYSGVYENGGHCQGIAVDTKKRCVYYSFTTRLVKTDFEGNFLGSVTGLIGHLGCIDFDPEDGMVYGSLEFKNDAIGKGILAGLHLERTLPNAFYCAIFDGDRINARDMDACTSGVMRAAYLRDVVSDYEGVTEEGLAHIGGCSGIDGTAIGPMPGCAKASEKYVFIAYGIYGDVTRDDNDKQIILCYRPEELKRTARLLSMDDLHAFGPEKPLRRLTAHTGNTVYGIQNLEYDRDTGDYLAAVYCGKKPVYANKPMYVLDGNAAPKGNAMTVRAALDFPYGQTGMSSLGGGLWYFSEDGGDRAHGWHTVVRLYRRTEDGFTRV